MSLQVIARITAITGDASRFISGPTSINIAIEAKDIGISTVDILTKSNHNGIT